MAQSRKVTNKELLLDAAMQVVSEVGLHSFSMRQVTNMCKVSDMLIYRHYQSKDNFLRQCYLRAAGEMKELFKCEKPPELDTYDELHDYLHDIWIRYITYLIQNSSKTIYCFEYRNSKFYNSKESAKAFNAEMDRIIPNAPDAKYNIAYILDVTVLYAVRAIRKEVPKDKESLEKLWNTLWDGISPSAEIYTKPKSAKREYEVIK